MTTTTIGYAATLRALADHIEKHDLGQNVINIKFDDVRWDGLQLQLHIAATVAAWVRSLDCVSATAFWHGVSVHVRITGALDNGIPVQLLFIATAAGDRDLIAEFRNTLLDTDSSWTGGTTIELPEALGGAR